MDVMNFMQYLQHEQAGLNQKYNHLLSIVTEILKSLTNEELKISDRINTKIKCKFYNRGYCREKSECKFSHLNEICQQYHEFGGCEEGRGCKERHPNKCKFWLKGDCWRGENCLYLHKEDDFGMEMNADDKDINKEPAADGDAKSEEMDINNHDSEENEVTTDQILKMYEDEVTNDDENCKEITVDEILKMYEVNDETTDHNDTITSKVKKSTRKIRNTGKR